MSWVKLDDQFADHPKVLEVGPLAECLFVRGLTYASRYLTDGFVPAAHLRRMGDLDAMAEAAKLVDAGLWEETDGGFQIHDYLDYQPSADKVKAERDAARERMQKARSGKRDANNVKRSPDVLPNNARSSDNPVPSRPVPNTSPVGDKPPTPPKAARAAPDYSQDFETFWRVYPRKVAKDAAWKAWKQRLGSMPPVDALVSAVEAQKTSDQWQKDSGQYIPHPATWLHNGRWNDEPPAVIAPFNPKPGQRMSGADIMARLASLERQERSS